MTAKRKPKPSLPPFMTVADAHALADRLERCLPLDPLHSRACTARSDMAMAIRLIRALLRGRDPAGVSGPRIIELES